MYGGTIKEFKSGDPYYFKGYEWLTKLSFDNVYLLLHAEWPSSEGYNLPDNYDFYVVSFHLEAVDISWLKQQTKRIKGRILVLHDGNSYNYVIPKVTFFPYYYWHVTISRMQELFGNQRPERQITHKFSAFCNRIQTSKLLVFTALAENTTRDESLLALHEWYEEENVYIDRNAPTKVVETYDLFFEKYFKKKVYKIDDFTNDLNYQHHTANPWTPAYQNAAIHFTNESFSTTYMYHTDTPYNLAIAKHPGPMFSEKTLKCLMGGTSFIPVCQYDAYGTLNRLGLNFNYDFDTSFDYEENDFKRWDKILRLIENLSELSAETLYKMTKDCTEQNFAYVKEGVFYREVEKLNAYTAEQVIEHIKQTA